SAAVDARGNPSQADIGGGPACSLRVRRRRALRPATPALGEGGRMSATAPRSAPITNAMTVDVEDYFQVAAFERCIARADWPRWPVRVDANTRRILELFARQRIHATFFILGWVAERYPALVRD